MRTPCPCGPSGSPLGGHGPLSGSRQAGPPGTPKRNLLSLGASFGASGEVAGVEIRDTSPRSRIEGMAIVVADGASIVLARSLGALDPSPRGRSLAVAARGYACGVRLPDPFVEMHTSAEILPGCAWLVPTGPDDATWGSDSSRAPVVSKRFPRGGSSTGFAGNSRRSANGWAERGSRDSRDGSSHSRCSGAASRSTDG